MYQITRTTLGDCLQVIVDGGVCVCVPTDEANTDYQQYLEWLAEGNEPEVIELSG